MFVFLNYSYYICVCVHGGMYVHVWVNVKCMKMCVVEEDGGNESVSVCDSPLLFEHKSIKKYLCVWMLLMCTWN